MTARSTSGRLAALAVPTTHRRRSRLPAVLGVLILVAAALSGCASTPPTPPGMFSFYLGEPQRPLVPGNTTESEGSKIISAVWTPLVTFDVKSRAVTYDGAAESVTSTDNMHWTIKLKPGWRIPRRHPGDRGIYVKAWNYTALSTNAPGRVVLLLQYRRLRRPAGGGGRRGRGHPDVRSAGGRSHHHRGHPLDPVRDLPGDAGLQRIRSTTRGLLCRSGGVRQEADRPGPFRSATEWLPVTG